MNNLVAITTDDARRLTVIAERTNATSPLDIVSAGIKMQMLNELKKRMRESVVEFYFVKKNGELRRAFGTTMPALAKAHIKGTGIPRESVNVTPYFDTEKGAWRSLRYESIVRVC